MKKSSKREKPTKQNKQTINSGLISLRRLFLQPLNGIISCWMGEMHFQKFRSTCREIIKCLDSCTLTVVIFSVGRRWRHVLPYKIMQLVKQQVLWPLDISLQSPTSSCSSWSFPEHLLQAETISLWLFPGNANQRSHQKHMTNIAVNSWKVKPYDFRLVKRTSAATGRHGNWDKQSSGDNLATRITHTLAERAVGLAEITGKSMTFSVF